MRALRKVRSARIFAAFRLFPMIYTLPRAVGTLSPSLLNSVLPSIHLILSSWRPNTSPALRSLSSLMSPELQSGMV